MPAARPVSARPAVAAVVVAGAGPEMMSNTAAVTAAGAEAETGPASTQSTTHHQQIKQ